MADLIANADGNITGASTFAATEAGATSKVTIRANAANLASGGTITTPTFTITNTDVIDGVLLWLYVSSGTTGTGTLKVDLQKAGVSQKSVTVNLSDLPDANNAVPAAVLFKFGSTFTGDGASTYTFVLTGTAGTGTAVVTYNRGSATAGDLTRIIRRTTAATAAAADNLFILGELTGAGTHNARAVYMDSTAATAYGNGTVNTTAAYGGLIAIGNFGTLSYGISTGPATGTNYVLRIAGDLIVYQNGTLNIGSSGAEIPRTSTAVLEFQPVSASGDFGLRNQNGTVNMYGLSRTSGKNITKCKLTSDVTGSSVLTSNTSLNVTVATSAGVDAAGVSLLASTAIDTVTNANHTISFSGPSVTNTTQSFQVWLARGTGTNNRFVRLEVGNNAVLASVTKGFFADVDLQAGTIGTCTAVGTGTATSAAIQAVGGGFLCTIVGKVDGSAATPTCFIAICSAAGTTSFAGANNQALVYEGVQLVTTSSIGDTTLNVDTDTGWLSGDSIGVASTTRTATDCEDFVLSANAGASSLVTHLYPFGHAGPTVNTAGTHNGSSPIQAEVGLITRNVRIRSTSNTLAAYVYSTAISAFTAQWTQFYYLGISGTSNKRGVELDTTSSGTATAKSITFCSLHDTAGASAIPFYVSTVGGVSANLTFSNNVIWNTAASVQISGVISSGDWTFDAVLAIKAGYTINSLQGTFTNITAVGFTSTGFTFTDNTSPSVIMGTFNNITAHSCNAIGINISSFGPVGTFGNLSSWRNASTGLNISGGNCMSDAYFSNLTVFGNATFNVTMNESAGTLNIIGSGSVIAGDTTFSTAHGINFNNGSSGNAVFDIINLDMSGVGGIYAPHTTDDVDLATGFLTGLLGVMNNCKFGAASPFSTKTNWAACSAICMEKYNQTSGDHRTEMKYGTLKTDATIVHTSPFSMRMTPNSASNKLASAPKGRGILFPVASGAAASVSAYIRKSVIGDGTAYNGNQPRLMQRANPALGQNADVVLATYSSAAGSWNVLTVSTSTATDDGAWEIFIDCDGTTGWINVDWA